MVGGRELTIFCIDVSRSMSTRRTLKEDPDHSDADSRSITNLEYGLEVVKNQVANMLLAGLKTVHCGIILFGADRTQNSLSEKGYQYIWEYVAPCQPTALTLSQIDGISLHLSVTDAPDKGDLLSALILCNHLMGETLVKKKWARKLVLVTDANSETDWNGVKEERSRMRNDDVELTVVGLDFDAPEIGYFEFNKSEIKAANEVKLHKLCRSMGNGSTCMTALVAVSNAQSPQRRVIGSNPTRLTLSLGFPDADLAQAEGKEYIPEQTLRVSCELRKCTTVVRPMTAKKITKLGARSEQERQRAFVTPRQTGGELEQFLPQDAGDDEDIRPSGLLQIDRKYVYVDKLTEAQKAKITRMGDESDDQEDGESSDEELAPVKLREADQNMLVKAYKYGASRVVVDKEDEEQIRQTFYPSLQIRGFARLDDVPRHHLMNNVYYLSADSQDARSQLTLSALVRALKNTERAALARYVAKSNSSEPKLVILIPVVEPEARYFLFVQVPFAEDLREYFFPPLECEGSSEASRKTARRHVPTEEMVEAMDALVDDMDLAAVDGKADTDGPTRPWLVLEQSCSPAIHHLKNCVLHRLTHPDSEDLPAVHPALARCLTQPPHVAQRAAVSLERAKRLLDVKPVQARIKKRKMVVATQQTEETQQIDLDAILGTGPKRVESGSTGKEPDDQLGSSPTKEDVKNIGDCQESALNIDQLQQGGDISLEKADPLSRQENKDMMDQFFKQEDDEFDIIGELSETDNES